MIARITNGEKAYLLCPIWNVGIYNDAETFTDINQCYNILSNNAEFFRNAVLL